MVKTRLVAVMGEHIREAIRRDSNHCMIADAIQQAIPEAKYIRVDIATIRFSLPETGKRYVYITPKRAQRAIVRFDLGRPVQPFTLRLARGYIKRMREDFGKDRTYDKTRKHVRTSVKMMTPSYREYGLANFQP